MNTSRSDKRLSAALRPGFALVVTISLMVLLAMLAVGLLSLSSITLRTNRDATTEARANARLALALALGQLQKHAGLDTRVTANAGLTHPDSPNQHWVGVHMTRRDEKLSAGQAGTHPVGHHQSDRYLTDLRAASGSNPAPTWLVSSQPGVDLTPDMAADAGFITLLQTGDDATTVRVPRLDLERGACAWWTSDENQKARLSLADPADEQVARQAYSLIAAQDFDFERYKDAGGSGTMPLAGMSAASSGIRESLPSIGTTSLAAIADPGAFEASLEASIHHLTTQSVGIFSDTTRGGLRQDLSTFLAVGELTADSLSGRPGLRLSDPILPGDHHLKTSPRFGILQGWAALAEQLNSDSGEGTIKPQAPQTHYFQANQSVPGHVRDLTDVSVPAVQPVVVEASLGWDFSPWSPDGGENEFVRSHIMPRLTLWNPFNVTLAPTRYLVLLRHPRYGSLQARGQRVDSRAGRFYFDDACGRPQSAFLGFVTKPTLLSPGETRIFTPDVIASSGAKLFGRAAAFDPINYAANVLTSSQIPGVENFYFDTQTPLPPATAANRFAPYGFATNMNSFYATPAFSDEFVVIQLPESATGPVRWQDVTADRPSFPHVGHFLCQNWGLNRYHKWYGAEASNHPSNNATPFREFRPGAPDIGSIDNRRPPRLWRRGVRLAWFDDSAEHTATARKVPRSRFTHPWFSASNVRGGLLHHPSWATIPYAPGWQWPWMDGHSYFLQPTDPQQLATFFPPSPIAEPGDGFPSVCSIYDIPRKKPGIISLGQLQHAQLSYATWHPSLVIGHSQPTTNADLDATAIKDRIDDPKRWLGDRDWNYDPLIQAGGGAAGHDDEVLVYDLSFEVNFALWDRFMLSSIPFFGGPSNRQPNWQVKEPLPVGRYRFQPSSVAGTPDELASKLEGNADFAFHSASTFLGNHGAFNVNSVSVPAWRALLGTMRGLQVTALDGRESEGDHPLTRSVQTPAPGVTGVNAASDDAAWNAFRSLTDADLDVLAPAIVDEVRLRGPFLSLADFVNRRLEDSALGESGALDAAIRNSRTINQRLDRDGQTETRDTGDVATASNRPSVVGFGIPGYFTQGDLLNALAPAITARGDTFLIRAYGEARDPDGTVATATCEAVVQRTVDYVDPADPPNMQPVITVRGRNRVNRLSKASLSFGRRFEVRSFRWLSNTSETS